MYLEIIKSILSTQPNSFVLKNHPFQAFLGSKTYTFLNEEKKLTFLIIYPLRHVRGSGLRETS